MIHAHYFYNIFVFFIKFAEGTALLDELKKKAICSAPEQNTDQPNVKEGALMLQVSNLSNVQCYSDISFLFLFFLYTKLLKIESLKVCNIHLIPIRSSIQKGIFDVYIGVIMNAFLVAR